MFNQWTELVQTVTDWRKISNMQDTLKQCSEDQLPNAPGWMSTIIANKGSGACISKHSLIIFLTTSLWKNNEGLTEPQRKPLLGISKHFVKRSL